MTDIVERLRAAANGIGSMKTERGDYGLLDEAAAEIERLRSALGAAEGRATDYRTVAINQGWNWSLCDAYGREEYAKQRGEHVDACALNATEARARAAQMDGEG